MTPIPRRSSRTLVLCALVLASQTIVTTSPPQKPCETLRRWAQQYAGTRPTLDDLAPFDRAHRLAIFTAIRPDARAALWREQLTRFESQPDLTASQRALVREGIALTTPALYSGHKAAAASLALLWTRVEPAFSRTQLSAWVTLGSVLSAAAAPATTGNEGFCECSSAYGWLHCESMSCPSAGCEEWLGCGPNGGNVCNGYCKPVSQ
jgi:hypothetical protein